MQAMNVYIEHGRGIQVVAILSAIKSFQKHYSNKDKKDNKMIDA